MNATYSFDLNNRPGRDGRHSLFLRITVDRKLKRIKTGIALKPAEFDKTAAYGKWVRSKHPEHKQFNEDLKALIRRAEEQQKQLSNSAPISSNTIAYSLVNKPTEEAWTLGAFADKIIADAATHSVGYERNLKSRLTVFVEFTGKDTPLTSVSLETLNRFQRHLKAKGLMLGTQHTYFNRIKKMVVEAIKLEIVIKDPFQHFKMPADTPAPRLKLSDSQIAAIEAIDVTGPRIDTKGRKYGPVVWLFRAKYLYLFSYYMGGIRSRDMLQLRWGNIVGEKGSERLEYQMSKTGKPMSTKLNDKARQIVELFRRESVKPQHYLFGVLANDADYIAYVTHDEKKKMPRELAKQLFNDISCAQVLINRQLKTLASKVEIKEHLTFHTARHSFADKARRRMKESKNISVDDIRQALGHDKLDTTQKYLNAFDKESLDSAMDAVFDG